MKVISKEINYRVLKESIRMINGQSRDAEKLILMNNVKIMSIDEITKHNKFVINNVKSQT